MRGRRHRIRPRPGQRERGRAIMQAAQDEGLAMTADEIDELLAEHSN